MLYISGALCWIGAFGFVSPHLPGWHAFAGAFLLWLGLVQWELAMRENRKNK